MVNTHNPIIKSYAILFTFLFNRKGGKRFYPFAAPLCMLEIVRRFNNSMPSNCVICVGFILQNKHQL